MKKFFLLLSFFVAFWVSVDSTLSPASAELVTVTSGDVLEIRFDVPVPPSPDRDMFFIFANGSTVTGYFTTVTEIFDGDTLLGTYTEGWSQITSRWVTADSLSTIGNPQVIDFTSLLDGSISGLTRMTITGDNSITFDTEAVQGKFGTAISSNSWYQDPVEARILSVTINPGVNEPPIADAGNNQALVALSWVTLDGTQSFDPENDDITYAWTLDTPASSFAVLDDATSATPSFTADTYGDYVATLVVTDTNGLASDPDSVTVGFENLPPVGDAGLNQAAVVGDLVLLDGSSSSDVNMDSLTYLWSFDTKPASSLALIVDSTSEFPSFLVDEVGDYVVRLVVNDGLLDSAPSTVSVTAISAETATQASVIDTVNVVNTVAPEDFENRNMQNALTNKLNAVLRMIDQGNYIQALDKLENDVLSKTDGCASTGAPDSNDWIVSCDEQENINLIIAETIELLHRLID